MKDKMIEAEGMSVVEYIQNFTPLYIPENQRPYEWKKQHVERLIEDILDVATGQVDKHILNFITLYSDVEENKKYIYDGQQRSISILLLFTVLRKILSELEQTEQVENTEKELKSLLVVEPRMLSNFKDSTYYINPSNVEMTELIVELSTNSYSSIEDLSQETTDYTKAIIDNIKNIENKIFNYTSQKKIEVDYKLIFSIVQALLNDIIVIVMTAENLDISNRMFETLNNTGKKIESFYVLKNEILTIDPSYNVKWDDIEQNLDSLNKSRFLQNYLSMHVGKFTKSNTNNEFKQNGFLNEDNIESTIDELVTVSKYFLEIAEAPHKCTFEKDEKIKFENNIQFLKLAKVTQHYPVVLALLTKRYRECEINNVLELVINLYLRNFFFGKSSPSSVEEFYTNLAKRIYNEIIPLDEIKNSFSDIMFTNEQLEVFMKDKDIKTSTEKNITKYILREIYSKDYTAEVNITTNFKILQLEHILPQTPKDSWNGIFEEPEKYIHKIGNLTILLDKLNNVASNSVFSEKSIEYKKSSIPHNIALCNVKLWNKDAIETRSDELFKSFINIWKLEN